METTMSAERKAHILKAADLDFSDSESRFRTKMEKLEAINRVRLEVHRILEDGGSYDNPEVEVLAEKWCDHVETRMLSFRAKIHQIASNAMTDFSKGNPLSPRDIFGHYVLLVTGLLSFLMILFPPFYIQDGRDRSNLGYAFLFSPPTDEYDERGLVNVSLLVTQMFAVFAGAGLVYAGRGAMLHLAVRVTRKPNWR